MIRLASVLLLGCQASPIATSEAVDTAAIEDALAAFAAWIPLFDEEPVRAIVDAFLTGGDGACPVVEIGPTLSTWDGDCTTTDTVFFLGKGTARTDDLVESTTVQNTRSSWGDDGPAELEGYVARAYAHVDLPTAGERGLDGWYGFVRATSESSSVLHRIIEGPVVDSQANPASWAHLQPTVEILEGIGPAGFERTIHGAIAGLSTTWSTVSVDDATITEGCDSPTGLWSVRDPEGSWLDVVFEGCDGCGEVQGAMVCPDLTPLWRPAP